jgi:hypothetical protein
VTEPVEEPPTTDVVPKSAEPVDPELEIARRNSVLGWALFGLALLLFAGTWAVAYIYLALD